ncbi:MAG: dienelactone hydrolase family protein [Thermoanaerobaculia bacterium]|jgi:carboxymethylenebutenolidase
MGQNVKFQSNGHTCEGYLALPKAKGPAVVVIQEWWGLVPHIEDLADRFAAAGFVAIAPDLYHGRKTTSPDTAAKLLMELDGVRAEREIAGAGDFVLGHESCNSSKFGVVGFCMGGALAQFSAASNPKVGAGVSFYGGFKQLPIPWETLSASMLFIYGENDSGVPPAQGKALVADLKAMGKSAEIAIYPGAGHAFFNDTRPQVYDEAAAKDAWARTLELFRRTL